MQQARRRAAAGRQAAAAGWICRNRSARSAAGRRPRRQRNPMSRNTSRSPRNAARPAACNTTAPRLVDAAGWCGLSPPPRTIAPAAASLNSPHNGRRRHESDRAGHSEDSPHPHGTGQELRLLLARRGGEVAGRHIATAGQPEGAAGERAALRGRHQLHGR